MNKDLLLRPGTLSKKLAVVEDLDSVRVVPVGLHVGGDVMGDRSWEDPVGDLASLNADIHLLVVKEY